MSKKEKVIEKLKEDPMMPLRHSAEHVMHTAVESLFKGAKKVMGPPIENGFYGDFDYDEKISDSDLEKIESRMQEIIDAKLPLEIKVVSLDEAKKIFAGNKYKLEFIDEFSKEGKEISICELGDPKAKFHDIDLCAGPHVKNTSDIKAFKLFSLAGAYWRGDEKNKMLTRIYATAFNAEGELNEYLSLIEEAKKRDHRRLGTELELFFFHETAPGIPYWLPKGLIIYNELVSFWRNEHSSRNYQEIASPLINKKELWEISGHWEHYKDAMFVANMGENEVYGVKPMNCPNAMIVFGSKPRSYRELPLRLSDTDTLHRYELAGTLHGLLRVRSFRQDDSHNFISEDMIEAEYADIFDIAKRFYGIFNMGYKFRLGTRPKSYMGDIETWKKAESALHKILEETVGKDGYIVEEGDGAFYGPKVDILMKDSLGRDWQLGTIQLDFQIPRKFNLKYTDRDGKERTPVVVHRVIYGSLERFIGIMIEHFGGNFPVWLSPLQVKIIPIGEKQIDYARVVEKELKDKGIRVEVDSRNDTMQSKIRDAQLVKTPYMLILGDREVQSGSVSVRLRTNENLGSMPKEEFLAKIEGIYLTKSLKLW